MKTLLRLGALVCALLFFAQLAFAQAAAPVISPAPGSYASTQSVTVTDSTSGADIFCTTDGSTPTPYSTKYTGPFTLTATTTVQCIAAVAGVRQSNLQNNNPNASGTYWKAPDCVNGGGSGVPTGLVHVSGVASPSLSGASMEFSMTAQTGHQTNCLWAISTNFGKCDTCSYQLTDYQLYLDSGVCTNNGTTEQDSAKVASSLGNLRYMGGAQWRRNGCSGGSPHACLDIGGNSNVSWTFTGVNIPLACGTFHHFQRGEHFVPSEVTSKPCVDGSGAHWPYVYEDYWKVDGVTYNNGGGGWKFCANSVNWPSWEWPQWQFDGTNGTLTMYLDQANFTAYFPGSSVSSSAFSITGGTGTPTAATPSITPGGGFYTTTQTVTLADVTPGAVIHYTTDGSTPNASSSTYSSALSVTTTTTVKAIAIASGYNNSSVASAVYSFSSSGGLTATPTFSPTSGSYTSAQFISLSDTTSGAVIYYTTDGTTPTTSSNVYSIPLSVTATATIKAMAVAPSLTNSSIATATFTITSTLVAATPTFSPGAGIFTGTQTVTISDSTPSSTIHYTTDGSTPTGSSTTYSTPLSITSTTTVKAIAVASGFSNSAVGSATYTIGCGQTPYATGNIDPTQIKAGGRQGTGLFVQMAAGGFTTNYAAVYDCNGNVIVGAGVPVTSITTTGSSGGATLSGGVLNIPVYSGGGGSGTVTSVALSLPAIFSVSGSPVTVSGTLTAALATQTANMFFAGPSSGSAAAPTFRTIAPVDLPISSSSAFGAAKCDGTTITCSGGVYAAVGGGSGTVTSVAVTVPSREAVSGSPVTGSGTIAITDNTQSANKVFAGPSSGSAAAPTFRSLVSADLPGGGGGGSFAVVESHTASSSAELDFTTCLSSTYDDYEIDVIGLNAATNGAEASIQFSSNGGSTYDASSIYDWNSSVQIAGSGSGGTNGGASQPRLVLFGAGAAGLLSTGIPGMAGSFKLYDPLSAVNYKFLTGQGIAQYSGDSNRYSFIMSGVYRSTTAANAFRVIMTSGNIAAGTVRCYGIGH
jgi:hypothetical protein